MVSSFTCPVCSHMMLIPEPHAGKRTKCPRCGTISRVAKAKSSQAEPGRAGPLSPQSSSNLGQNLDTIRTARPRQRQSQQVMLVSVVVLALMFALGMLLMFVLDPLGRGWKETTNETTQVVSHETAPADEPVGRATGARPPRHVSVDGPDALTTRDPRATRNGSVPNEPASAPVPNTTSAAEFPFNARPSSESPRPAKPAPGSLGSVDVIKQLHQQCQDSKWIPTTIADYEKFRELAEYVTAAQFLMDDASVEEGLRVIINAAAEEVLLDLSETRWHENAKLEEVNQMAVDGLRAPGRGVFAYVEVAYTARESGKVNDNPSVVFRLIGTEQFVIVPVRENPPDLRRDSRWLLLGLHDDSLEFTLSTGEPGAAEQIAPLIRAKFLVGQPVEVVKSPLK